MLFFALFKLRTKEKSGYSFAKVEPSRDCTVVNAISPPLYSSWEGNKSSSSTEGFYKRFGKFQMILIANTWRTGQGKNSKETKMPQKRIQSGWWSHKAIYSLRSYRKHLLWQNLNYSIVLKDFQSPCVLFSLGSMMSSPKPSQTVRMYSTQAKYQNT